jgi:hypothetical protein
MDPYGKGFPWTGTKAYDQAYAVVTHDSHRRLKWKRPVLGVSRFLSDRGFGLLPI